MYSRRVERLPTSEAGPTERLWESSNEQRRRRVQNHHGQCNDYGDDALANVIIYVIINTVATVKLRQRLTSRLPHYNAAPSASVQ